LISALQEEESITIAACRKILLIVEIPKYHLLYLSRYWSKMMHLHASFCSGSLPKIALIIVFFGKAPVWLPAFLLSCRYNPEVTWLLFTDIERPFGCPDNVKFIPLQLNEFNKLASVKLGIKVDIKQSFLYKICDLKLTFGVVFHDHIRDFDFWGHCDLDVIWGDFSSMLEESMFEDHDIITSRINRISGHFCLYRNSKEVNETYQWVPNFKKMVFLSEKHFAIDEDHLTNYLYLSRNPNFTIKIKHILFRKQKILPKVYWERVLTTSGADQRKLIHDQKLFWFWKEGKAYDADGKEMLYLHFHKFKQEMKFIEFGFESEVKVFKISPNGFFIN
jgi:hypothetical protein